MNSADSASRDMNAYLRFMAERDASDLFLTVAAHPSVKVHGTIRPISLPPLTSEAAQALVDELLDPAQRAKLASLLKSRKLQQ